MGLLFSSWLRRGCRLGFRALSVAPRRVTPSALLPRRLAAPPCPSRCSLQPTWKSRDCCGPTRSGLGARARSPTEAWAAAPRGTRLPERSCRVRSFALRVPGRSPRRPVPRPVRARTPRLRPAVPDPVTDVRPAEGAGAPWRPEPASAPLGRRRQGGRSGARSGHGWERGAEQDAHSEDVSRAEAGSPASLALEERELPWRASLSFETRPPRRPGAERGGASGVSPPPAQLLPGLACTARTSAAQAAVHAVFLKSPVRRTPLHTKG